MHHIAENLAIRSQSSVRPLTPPGMFVGLLLSSFTILPAYRAAFKLPEIAYAIILGILITYIIMVKPRKPVYFAGETIIFVVALAGFIAWMLSTGFWTITPSAAASDAVLLSYMLLVLICFPFVCTPSATRWCLNFIVLAGIPVAIVVFSSYLEAGSLRGWGLLEGFYLSASRILGISAVASVLRVIIAPRQLWIAVSIILLSALALGQGRWALLTAVGVILLFGLFTPFVRQGIRDRVGDPSLKKFSPIRIGWMAALASGLTLFLALQVDRTAARLRRLFFDFQRELEVGRGEMWRTAWSNIDSAPFFGHGLGSNGIMSGVAEGAYPHNFLLQTWLDGGAIAIVILTFTLIIPYVVFWCYRNRWSALSSIPWLGLYTYFILQYLVSYNFYTARSIAIFGLISVIAISSGGYLGKMGEGSAKTRQPYSSDQNGIP